MGALAALLSPFAYGTAVALTASIIALLVAVFATKFWLQRHGARAERNARRARRFAAAAVLAGAFSCTAWQVATWRAARWPETLDERELVEARIESIPARSNDDLQFTASFRERDHAGATARRAQIDWPAGPVVHPGESWQLLVELRAARGRLNPGAADAERQYLRGGVNALGRVRDSPLNRRLATRWSLDLWRERLGQHIRAAVAERDSAALLVALAVGDTQYVSGEQWRIFNANGITHLVAISGLHVTLFCLVMARLARLVWRCVPWLQRVTAREDFALVLGWLASAGYALLAGWSVPTQRTLIMLAAWHGARVLLRPPAAVPSLSLALIAVLLLDPTAPLAAGFWLSFVAVGVLMAGGSAAAQGGWWHEFVLLWRTQWRVGVALLPLSLAIFGSFSLVSLFVNLLAIPFFSFVLVPLVLCGTLLDLWPNALGGAVLQFTGVVAGLAWPVLRWLAESPWSLWRFAPPWWWYALAAVALPVALLPWSWRLRLSAGAVLLPLIAPAGEALRDGDCRLTLLDVGRGEALLVRTAHHTLAYDNGEVWGSQGRVSAGTLLAALRYYHRSRVDLLLLPALDADRMAGVNALAASVRIGAVASGVATSRLPPEIGSCGAQQPWDWDRVRFTWLPAAAHCVLLIETGTGSVFVLGDADVAATRAALAATPRQPRIVVAPRSVSVTEAALGAMPQPQWLLFSQSLGTLQTASFRHLLQSLHASGAQPLLTGALGALDLSLSPDGAATLTARRQAHLNPVWRWPATDVGASAQSAIAAAATPD